MKPRSIHTTSSYTAILQKHINTDLRKTFRKAWNFYWETFIIGKLASGFHKSKKSAIYSLHLWIARPVPFQKFKYSSRIWNFSKFSTTFKDLFLKLKSWLFFNILGKHSQFGLQKISNYIGYKETFALYVTINLVTDFVIYDLLNSCVTIQNTNIIIFWVYLFHNGETTTFLLTAQSSCFKVS